MTSATISSAISAARDWVYTTPTTQASEMAAASVRVGARVWIARIMLSWGAVSASFGFIPQLSTHSGLSPQTWFYVLRFLLGVCEAGFYPGVVFYLTRWFPEAYRARVIAFFMLAVMTSA